MRVKKYVVDSMPEALRKIRGELGKDAVILNSKEIKSGGFLGFFGKKKIEVIAATDNAPSQVPAAAASGASPNRPAPVAVADREEPPRIIRPVPVHDVHEDRTAGMSAAAAPPVAAAVAAKSTEETLLEEMRQMKAMMARLSQAGQAPSPLPESLEAVKEKLEQHEVGAEVISSLMHSAMEEAGSVAHHLTMEQAVRLVKNSLLQMLRRNGKSPLAADTRIAQFVGPTGVGKTTTIAKLAAEQVLKYNRKVGFITSDTYRISAVEQLRTYATILNVPLEVVFSSQEFQKAYQKLGDCELIFMDTAGRNYKNEMYVSELNSLLPSKGKIETYLVLSLTSKYKDMKVITENFSKYKLDKWLFTKMDETDTYGAIVNLAHAFPLKLSYIANGQNVPDDIIQVNEEQLIDLMLEGLPDE